LEKLNRHMKLILEINNLDSCKFSQKKLELIIAETIKRSPLGNFFKKNVLISIAIVSEEEIRKINKKYRNKDSSTDILSFGDFNSIEELKNKKEEDIFLGELLICCQDIEKYCKEKNIEFEREFSEVLSHGVLHLLGFDHTEEMFALQKSVADYACA